LIADLDEAISQSDDEASSVSNDEAFKLFNWKTLLPKNDEASILSQ
jgi:hypothetical protein